MAYPDKSFTAEVTDCRARPPAPTRVFISDYSPKDFGAWLASYFEENLEFGPSGRFSDKTADIAGWSKFMGNCTISFSCVFEELRDTTKRKAVKESKLLNEPVEVVKAKVLDWLKAKGPKTIGVTINRFKYNRRAVVEESIMLLMDESRISMSTSYNSSNGRDITTLTYKG